MNAGSTNTDAADKTYTGGDWNATTDTYTAPVGSDFTGVANGQYAALFHDGDTTPITNQYLVGPISNLNAGARTFVLNSTGRVLLGTEVATGSGNRSVKIGGAWGPPSGTNGFPLNFFTSTFATTATNPAVLWIKSDVVMQMTSNITIAGTNIIIEGYETTPGDLSVNRPKISGKTVAVDSAFLLVTTTGTGIALRNIWFDGNFSTATVGTSGTGNYILTISSNNCVVENCLFTDSYRGCILVSGASDKGGARIWNNDFHNYNWADASDYGAIIATEECSIMFNRMGTPNPDFISGGDSMGVHIDGSAGENIVVMFNTITNQTKAGITMGATVNAIVAYNTIDNAAGYGILFMFTSASSLLIRDNIISRCQIGIRGHGGQAGASGLNIRNNVFYDVATKFSQINPSCTDGTETALTAAVNPFAVGTATGTTGDLSLNDLATGGGLARGAALGFVQPTTAHFSAPGVTHADIGAMQSEATGSGPIGGSDVSFVRQPRIRNRTLLPYKLKP